MKIPNTKFDVGQTVWLVKPQEARKICPTCGHNRLHLAAEHVVRGPLEIDHFEIRCYADGGFRMPHYHLIQRGKVDLGIYADEDYIFATQEEATANCKERNAAERARREAT
jgi:hypothetical protein